ncbi:hypothetical protein O6H91_15G087800 [Diphasiastrum complanatum]|uniref:Uncharacterized protein n=1 Tax=Diphasiastrum complanatum TaxID=34168 RepID=A0ACC2BKJ3_DIPCM|nr:hypothetical protein O6H91_15G087800 [Diphasiastrum complanatum]
MNVGESAMAFTSKQRNLFPEGLSSFPSEYTKSSLGATSSTQSYCTAPASSTGSIISASIAIATRKRKPRYRDHGRVSTWIEGMRAASPPRVAILKTATCSGARKVLPDTQYNEWVAKHPSALATFESMMEAAKGKQMVLFLDYDGTLSPIVEDPDQAYMSEAMRAAVKEVAMNIPTAIISGRGRDKVYEFVQLAEIFYAGSHGMDIMGPAEACNGLKADGLKSKDEKGNEVVFFQPATEFLVMIDEVYKTLEHKTKNIVGAKVEHNKFCVSVHFRRVEEKNWQLLAEEVEFVIKQYPKLHVTQGRKVLEVRPTIHWDKGKAVEFLLKAFGLANPHNLLPVYIGDDQTDEDAFSVLNKEHIGYGILVSSAAKATGAAYSLKSPSEVPFTSSCRDMKC